MNVAKHLSVLGLLYGMVYLDLIMESFCTPGPIREKTSQSGQEEEKSNIFPQGVSIKSCAVRLDFSRIHWCNIALLEGLMEGSLMTGEKVNRRGI